MNNFVSTDILIILIGIIGGLLHSAFLGFKRPGNRSITGTKDVIYQAGWIGELMVGGGAAFIVWTTGLGNPNPPQCYGLALLSGLIGAQILNSYISNRSLKILNEGFSKALGEKMDKEVSQEEEVESQEEEES